MAASAAAATTTDPETKETASRCTTAAEKGAHTFEIVGYSLKTRGMGTGNSVQSGTFTVGGCDWVLRFCPNFGSSSSDAAFIHVVLLTKNVEVRARCEVWLVKRPSGSLGALWTSPAPPADQQVVFGPGSGDVRSASVKMSRKELEASGYIHGDCLTIRAVVTVIKESKLSATTSTTPSEIEVPPPDITAHIGKLLEDKEGADVTFSVGGESFAAHKLVLAARSPVFKAELCGPMRTRARCVAVEDMQPEVFRVLLHFAYTDSLPRDLLGELAGDDYSEMIRHLLVAADRYAMDRLKLMCQNILGRNLDVENVATTLGLADQYNCDRLKDACIEFMMNLKDAVMETKGYANLRKSCPAVIVEVYERTNKRRRICK